MFLHEICAVFWSWSVTGWECCSVSFGFRSYNRVDFNIYLQSLKQGNDICPTATWLWRQSHAGEDVISTHSFLFVFGVPWIFILYFLAKNQPNIPISSSVFNIKLHSSFWLKFSLTTWMILVLCVNKLFRDLSKNCWTKTSNKWQSLMMPEIIYIMTKVQPQPSPLFLINVLFGDMDTTNFHSHLIDRKD